MSTMPKPGEFYHFTPRSNWCREGISRVTERGVMVDTYWGLDCSEYDYQLLEDERATAELFFDSNDYEKLPDRSEYKWEQYHPDDRRMVSTQHGCTKHLYIRKGAAPHLETRIDNARRSLEEAQSALRSASWTVERRERDLDELLAEKEMRGGEEP